MLKQNAAELWSVASGHTGQWWANQITVDFAKYDYIAVEDKPHLQLAEPVRKAITKRPPDLIKKFGSSYSNRGSSFNKGFNNRQFSRKAF